MTRRPVLPPLVRVLLAACLLLPLAVGASGPAGAAGADPEAAARGAVRTLPPADLDWDYQLGGPAEPPARVGTVVRDRREAPAAGTYAICYVNGFQTQPDERRFWRARWDLVLKKAGSPVVDSAWGEWLLDIRTAAKRERLARIVAGWTAGCAADGYDAVELDNLDSFTRSRGLLSAADARAFARLLVSDAHAAGLAVAQKNWVELGARGPQLGFDFAIAEECGRWRECQGYVDTYGPRVLMVEYRDADFAWTCGRFGDHPVVRRDLALSAGGVRAWC
ncbi:endo alpha-1,4 polygalactosaminidase [Nocardioides sp. HDW12B]|uniref:endo alpha-1,4 polygalactosaminidase n=1 Tax=Nocardioides sp. HDW12B TaxID=2714939 RepID=UPI00140880C8|nr:endo alpha-1,4 polygalactosaminidase [Nocardioides sp. HDW12B]QIK67092.1 endo alpha-1,4 polygalactosaminidase [Nocardioides sp. HDW12B]